MRTENKGLLALFSVGQERRINYNFEWAITGTGICMQWSVVISFFRDLPVTSCPCDELTVFSWEFELINVHLFEILPVIPSRKVGIFVRLESGNSVLKSWDQISSCKYVYHCFSFVFAEHHNERHPWQEHLGSSVCCTWLGQFDFRSAFFDCILCCLRWHRMVGDILCTTWWTDIHWVGKLLILSCC